MSYSRKQKLIVRVTCTLLSSMLRTVAVNHW